MLPARCESRSLLGWWLPLGIASWMVVSALGFSAARLGTSATLAIVIGALVVSGLVIDHMASRLEFGAAPAVGAALLVAGAVLVSWR